MATEPRGPEIPATNGDHPVVVYRAVHPDFVQEGRVTSQAYRLSGADGGLLSVRDGRVVSAEEACHRHRAQGRRAAGVAALQVQDYHGHNVRVFEDPCTVAEDGFDDDSHALADLRALSPTAAGRLGKKLVRASTVRLFEDAA